MLFFTVSSRTGRTPHDVNTILRLCETELATMKRGKHLHVCIVGASLGGMCAAVGLRRAGVKVVLLEAKPSIRACAVAHSR